MLKIIKMEFKLICLYSCPILLKCILKKFKYVSSIFIQIKVVSKEHYFNYLLYAHATHRVTKSFHIQFLIRYNLLATTVW